MVQYVLSKSLKTNHYIMDIYSSSARMDDGKQKRVVMVEF